MNGFISTILRIFYKFISIDQQKIVFHSFFLKYVEFQTFNKIIGQTTGMIKKTFIS